MFLPTRYLKTVNWTLAVALTLQPILMAVPIPVAHAAPADSTFETVSPAYQVSAPTEPLVATMPALYSAPPAAPTVTRTRVEETLRTAPIMFIESETQPGVSTQGKEHARKTFQVQGANGSIWLAPDAMWVTLLELPAEETMEERLLHGPERMEAIQARANEPVEGVNLKISFEGATPNPRIEGFEPLDTKASYFIGNDPDKWRPDVPVWGGVRYANLYPGVDLVVSSKDGAWDWKLEVKGETPPVSLPSYLFGFATAQATPNPSPLDAVKLRIQGAEGLDVLSSGKFALQPAVGITTTVGEYALPLLDVVGAEPNPGATVSVADEVVEAPFAKAAVPKVMMGASQAGVDDLLYSTFLGGSGYEYGVALAVDASGAVYVTGPTLSPTFPTTVGAYDTTHNGGDDVFVTKVNASGSGLVYSTFLGGSNVDQSRGLAVDASGAAYVTGSTGSSDFPTTPGAYDTTPNGIQDVFVTKLNASGSGLAYSTFLGGGHLDSGCGLAVDATGAVYVTGITLSPVFPTTQDAYDTMLNGNIDIFVTKVNASGSDLVYSTFLGGSGVDDDYALAVDASGAVYVTGRTASSDFPTTLGVYDTTQNGDYDVFVTKVNASGNSLAYSTFLGGSGADYGFALAVDASGAAYVTGETLSPDFPTTAGAYDMTPNGIHDVFVTKLNDSGSGLAYSTLLGGSSADNGYALAVDASGAAYVTGSTMSSDFPPTPGAYDTTYNDYDDGFVTKLNASGSSLAYSTFLGSSGHEYSSGLAVDTSGVAYITGNTYSSAFPTTPGAYDTTPNGDFDGFVAKLRIGTLSSLTAGQAAGVREADTNFDNYGAYTQGQVGNPINTRTGNHTEYEVDLSVPTLAGALSFERSYSSENAKAINAGLLEEGTLSRGWSHNYEVHLILPTEPDTRVELYTAGGSRLGFEDKGDNTFDPETGVGGTLVFDDSGAEPVYIYRSTADIGYTFDDEGVLQSIDDGQGHELTLEYDDVTGLLSEVYSADSLRALFFGYDAQDRLDEVRTATVDTDGELGSYLAQSVSFTYSLAGDLERVTDVNGETWGYEYDDPINLHFLTARTDPNGDLIVGIEYDDQGRAFREENGAGETVVELTYGVGGETTIEYGQDGVGGSITHQYGAGDILRHQTDGAGGDTETGYAPGNFRVNSVIDPKGNETTMAWSDDGADLLEIQDAQTLPAITTTQYDRHHPTLVTNPDGTQMLFVYNGDGSAANPLPPYELIGSAAWDEDVLLLHIDNYVEGSSAVDANRVTRYEYNGLSLLTRVTRPDGTATCTTYTPLGQPEDVTENCTTSPTLPGENALTHYTYDELGRVQTVTDPIGRVTKYNYFDPDSLADEVIANYDAGRLPYGDGDLYNLSTRTYRDELGRVYATVANFYDATGGDLTAADISSGLDIGRNRVERVYFDAAGRVEASLANFVGDLNSPTPPAFNPANPDRNLVARTIYDGAGRVVATIGNYYEANIPGGGAPEPFDLNGDGVTDVTLEISTTETQYNRISRIAYDATGRIRTTTAAAWPGKANFYLGTYNLVSASAYDLAGNVTASITNYDPNWTDGDGDALSTSVTLSPGETPVSLIVDPDAPDRNVITCAAYDVLNRPVITTAACVPGRADYTGSGDSLYNLVSATYYDNMGRVYATVGNYDSSRGQLDANERNFITRAYYDGLGRVTHTVDNFVGNIESTTLPVYNTATPDRNLITGVFYNNRGYPAVTVRNLDTPSGLMPNPARFANTGPDRNRATVSHTNKIGQVDWTVDNFVGDFQTLPETPPANFSPDVPDQNLLTTYTYDELGRQVKAIARRGAEAREGRTSYDLLGRTTKTVANYQDGVYDPGIPDTDITSTTDFLNLGRIVAVTGTTGIANRTWADALGRITQSITDPGGEALTTTTTYDAAGRPVRTVVENGEDDQVTALRYDALGRAIQTIANPDGAGGQGPLSASTAYDLLGRTLSATDTGGLVTRNVYDSLGRLRQVFQNFQGAPACNPTTTDTNVCTRSDYDDAGHLTSTTLGNGSTTAYQVDALGRVTREIIDPGDAQHKNITTDTRYDAAGNRATLIRAPGAAGQQVTQTVFDRLGRPTAIHYADPALDVATSYDAWGGRATMDDAAGTGVWSYGYDDMNRLESVTDSAGQTVGYGYNGAGLRTSLNAPGMPSTITYGYDTAGRLDTITDPFSGGLVGYGYDGTSRVTNMTRPGGVNTTYQYDIFGRLDLLTNSGEPGALSLFDYTLDARGNRVDVEETLNGSPLASAQPAGLTPLGDQFSVIGYQFNSTGQSPDFGSLNASPLSLGLNQPFSAQRPAFIPAVQSLIPVYTETNQQSSIDQTATPESTPTATASPTVSPSPTPTVVEDETVTPTSEATATESPTGSPTPSPTPSPTSSPTSSPTPTSTPTLEPTATLPDGQPPQSDDPVFDLIRLPRDPAWGPTVEDGVLVAGKGAYHSTLGREGSIFSDEKSDRVIRPHKGDALAASDAEQPDGYGATFSLAAVQQGAMPITLPAPGALDKADAVSGWLVRDNIVLRPRLDGLYEINAFQAEGVELAYLLTGALPDAVPGNDLTLTVAIDSLLQPYQSEEGLLLLDENGNGIRVGAATAIDANGSETLVTIAVGVQSSFVNQQSSMSLVVPGSWLATAAYPILIDPLLTSWTAASARPAIAYDSANNRALVAFSFNSGSTGYIRTRLIDATTGVRIGNDVNMQSGTTANANAAILSVAFHQGTSGPEYLVAYKWSAAVRLCKVNASTGAKISCASPVSSGVTQAKVDIAVAPATGESLLVWGTSSGIRARRLTQSGATNGAAITVASSGTNPAVTFDEAANAYRVTWQASGSVMTAAVPRSSGSAQPAVSISSAASEPDVSYNPGLGETLFVWAGSSDGSIYGRSMMGGNLGPIFQVSSGIILVGEDHHPSAAPDGTRSGWVAAWQRGILGHAMLSIVPQGATGNLSTGNRSVSGDLVTGEFYPAAAMRGDGAALIALQRGAPGLEVAVYTVDDLGGPANVGWHYGYDALGRLTSACSQWSGSVCAGDQWTYTYDGAGNPTRFDRWNASTGQVETIHYLYNGANQVECIDADANGACNGTEFWVYDAHGNLTFDRATRYVYDAANHLATVCNSGDGLTCDALGNETTYQYSGDGARVAQSVRKGILPAAVTTYTLDTAVPLTQVLSETTNGQTTRYLHGLDLIAQSDGTSTEYLAYDSLGSVRQLVDGSGAVLTSQTFDPYGTPYSADELAAGSFGFTGEQTDENGLVYLRARYYNPAQGRFMQVDPSRLERNGYQYAGSSPGMLTDPSGLCVDPYDLYFDAWPMAWGGRPCLGAPNQYNSAAYQALIAPMTTNSGLTGTSVVGATTCALNFEICGPVLALLGEGVFWTSNIYAAGVTGQYVAADVFGTEAPSPAELQAVQDIAAGNIIGWQTGLWQQPVGMPYSWQSSPQAQVNRSRAWASLNEYYPSSAIGTASPGTLGRLVNGIASQRAANAMMAMPEYQVPYGVSVIARKSSTIYGGPNPLNRMTLRPLDFLNRPTGAYGVLADPLPPKGTKATIDPPGWPGGAAGYNRGHLWARVFGGSGSDKRNIVALTRTTNFEEMWIKYESGVQYAVQHGQVVEYSVIPIYQGNTLIPHAMTITAVGSGNDPLIIAISILNLP